MPLVPNIFMITRMRNYGIMDSQIPSVLFIDISVTSTNWSLFPMSVLCGYMKGGGDGWHVLKIIKNLILRVDFSNLVDHLDPDLKFLFLRFFKIGFVSNETWF